MYTKQQTFDIVVNALRKQNEKSQLGGKCRYRGPDGLKCAAGQLIPDELYSQDFDDPPVAILDSLRKPTAVGRIIASLGHNLNLVAALQSIHDGCIIESWETQFKECADSFSLEYTKP